MLVGTKTALWLPILFDFGLATLSAGRTLSCVKMILCREARLADRTLWSCGKDFLVLRRCQEMAQWPPVIFNCSLSFLLAPAERTFSSCRGVTRWRYYSSVGFSVNSWTPEMNDLPIRSLSVHSKAAIPAAKVVQKLTQSLFGSEKAGGEAASCAGMLSVAA